MPQFYYESTIKASAALEFEWHRDPAAIEKLTPPWEPVTVVGTPARIDEAGSRTTLELSMFGVMRLHRVAEHRNYQPGKSFQDVQSVVLLPAGAIPMRWNRSMTTTVCIWTASIINYHSVAWENC
jgi:ligand-binding SRPBCC domain-containing protein